MTVLSSSSSGQFMSAAPSYKSGTGTHHGSSSNSDSHAEINPARILTSRVNQHCFLTLYSILGTADQAKRIVR